MALPQLDRAGYENASSEWVMYAGQLLQAAGYLHSEPTGSYDHELATAVSELQQAHGIHHESDAIGPDTWHALGAVDPDTASHAGYEQSAAAGTQYAGYDATGYQQDTGAYQNAAYAAGGQHDTAAPAAHQDPGQAAGGHQWLLEEMGAGGASGPNWIVVIPAPADGSRGGWRYADWWIGFRLGFLSNIRVDFEVGTPMRNLVGDVSEQQASSELRWAMDAVGARVTSMLNDGLADPLTLPHLVRTMLDTEMRARIPGSRVGALGSTRTP